jgi:hypothetical protein
MGVVCFPIGSSGYPISAPAQIGAGVTLKYIDSQNTDGGAGIITINPPIPGGYKFLLLIGIAGAATAAQPVGLRFNSDTGANYATQLCNIASTSISAAANTDRHIKLTNGNYTGVIQAIIWQSTDLTKLVVSSAGTYNNGDRNNGRWNSTEEITKITIGGLSGTTETNLATNSRFYLYAGY